MSKTATKKEASPNAVDQALQDLVPAANTQTLALPQSGAAPLATSSPDPDAQATLPANTVASGYSVNSIPIHIPHNMEEIEKNADALINLPPEKLQPETTGQKKANSFATESVSTDIPFDLLPGNTFTNKLRLNVVLALVIPNLLITLVAIFIIFFGIAAKSNLALVLTGLSIILSGTSVLIVWLMLKPLEKVYSVAKELVSGSFKHTTALHSNDEISQIFNALNALSEKINNDLQKINQDKDITNTEKNKLSKILSALQDGLVVLTPDKKVVLANQEAERIIGKPTREMLGVSIDDLLALTDRAGLPLTSLDYCPLDNHNHPASYKNSQPVKLINKAAGEIAVIMSTTPIADDPGLGFLLNLQDTSRQKQLDEMQLDFVSMASHELRTPLTSIKGYLSVFMNENQKNLSKEQTEFLDRIMASTQELVNLVNNLLAVSKVERGAIAINTQPLDWDNIITQAVLDNQIQAKSKNISLKLEKCPNIPKVSADSVRIVEVLNNLIGNAVSYTQESGKIAVSVEVDGKEVTTAIKDNGQGISPADLPNLFTKFFRVQGALDASSNSKGTGLGLYLSKSIIDMHKGKIWAESEGLGHGSTFSFTLPVAEKTSVKESLAPLEAPTLKL